MLILNLSTGRRGVDRSLARDGMAAEVFCRRLSKAFGKTCAVEDVSFTLRDRELVAVLGPSEDDAISLCDGDHSSRLRTGLV